MRLAAYIAVTGTIIAALCRAAADELRVTS